MKKLRINNQGIKSALEGFKNEINSIPQAICEYIWNGYDAGASKIEVAFDLNDLERTTVVKIIDNGSGINSLELDNKFGNFLQSEKSEKVRRIDSNTHGKRGMGRLTFDYFASSATWKTIYLGDSEKFKYEIIINSTTIEGYKASEIIPTDEILGTEVILNVKENVNIDISKTLEYIKQEFCWLIELKDNFEIFINIKGNKKKLDYSDLVHDTRKFVKRIEESEFEIKLILWKEKIGKENSKYYFIDSNYIEKCKELTKFNKKSDGFKHSMYIKSDYFDNFDFKVNLNPSKDRTLYVTNNVNDDKFKFLLNILQEILRVERKNFLKVSAKKYITEKYEKRGLLPKYSSNAIGEYKKKILTDTLEEIYIYEPSLFNSLNNTQSKTLIRLIDLIINSDNPDSLFKILDDVIDLSEEERYELSSILNKTKLSNIISTIKLIEDRETTISLLKQMIYDNKVETKEVVHLQEVLERHFWIFGEQFKLLASAEDKFKTLLKRFWFEIKGEQLSEEDANTNSEYKYKNREVDLFLCRQEKNYDSIHNVIVELKRPSVKLGKKEFRQVEDYMEQIRNMDMFNADNYEWTFILVGNEFSNDGVIEGEIKNSKNHGERFLAKRIDNFKIYVKKWSEIFNEFDIRHNFLLEKLRLEEEQLIADELYKSSDELLEEMLDNTAVM